MKNANIIKSSFWGVIQSISNSFLAILTIPFFIEMLGKDLYGVFSLIMVLGNLNTFINFGFNTSLIKYLSNQGKTRESQIDITTNLIILMIFILPVGFFMILFNHFIMFEVLRIPLKFLKEIQLLYFMSIFANMFIFVGQVLSGIVDSLQLVDISNKQMMTYNMIYWGLLLLTIKMGYGLNVISYVVFVSALIWFVITLRSVHRYWGNFIVSIRYDEFVFSAKKQLGFGIKLYISGLIGFFYEPFSKILISNFLGVSFVGYFDIALRFKNAVYGLSTKIVYPLFPLLASMNDFHKIQNYVTNISQKIFLMLVPIISIIIFCLPILMAIWLDEVDQIVITISVSMVVGHLLFSVTVLPNYQFLITKGYVSKTIIIQLTNVICNFLSFYLILPFIDEYVIAVSNIIGIFSSFLLSLYFQKKHLGVFIFDNYVLPIKILLSYFVIFISIININRIIMNYNIQLFLNPVLIIILTIFLFRYLRVLNSKELQRYFPKNSKIYYFTAKILLR